MALRKKRRGVDAPRTIAVLVAMTLGGWALVAGPCAAATPTALERVQISRSEERGRLIYAYDQAAWHSTDEMQRDVPPAELPKTGGWVVEPHDDLLRVTYYSSDSGTPAAFFSADMRGSTVVRTHVFKSGDDRALSARASRMAEARSAAAKNIPSGFCTSGPPNNVVLAPSAASDPVPVYFLTSQVKTGEYPFGGHYEFDVASDGSVSEPRLFSRSCLNMSPPPNVPQAMAAVTYPLGSVPSEIHVWLSLWMGRPLLVATGPDRLWMVTNGHIELSDQPPPQGMWSP